MQRTYRQLDTDELKFYNILIVLSVNKNDFYNFKNNKIKWSLNVVLGLCG
jgi:hypothetical protein